MLGLVMEGGGVRGIYTAGVLDAFIDNNIEFDGMIGVSAGACFGPNLLSKQRGRAIRYNKKYNPSRKYMGVWNWVTTGNFFSTELAYNEVPRRLDPFDDEAYIEATKKTPLYGVTTNVKTGEAECMRINSVFEDMDIIRASASIPFLSQPVQIGDNKYLDGAIADSIPYEKFLEMGYDKLVVILTKDHDYVRKPIWRLGTNLIYKKKYPKVAEALINRHLAYNASRERLWELEKTGKVVIIEPTKRIKMSRIERNPDKMQAMYDLGIQDALDKLGEISALREV